MHFFWEIKVKHPSLLDPFLRLKTVEEGLFFRRFFVSETGVAVAARHYLEGGRGGGEGWRLSLWRKCRKRKKGREKKREEGNDIPRRRHIELGQKRDSTNI